jgi:hypothetical protein
MKEEMSLPGPVQGPQHLKKTGVEEVDRRAGGEPDEMTKYHIMPICRHC